MEELRATGGDLAATGAAVGLAAADIKPAKRGVASSSSLLAMFMELATAGAAPGGGGGAGAAVGPRLAKNRNCHTWITKMKAQSMYTALGIASAMATLLGLMSSSDDTRARPRVSGVPNSTEQAHVSSRGSMTRRLSVGSAQPFWVGEEHAPARVSMYWLVATSKQKVRMPPAQCVRSIQNFIHIIIT
jgi:hypothetical protein